ncbi:hypothetical protein DFH07DRAFT_909276 [Mycena maculata]|uniref:Protein kinase domain-containing protein n=1 Tax=Mycena maculata TaxID=230809 RepID=A0AAD7P098_9AGAR|nr:hypothetical protein DFH07DRAFT_909276 [Mycena maculata]
MSIPNVDAGSEPGPIVEDDTNAYAEGRLFSFEIFWRDHYAWLEERGYLLRERYTLGWTAPWKDDLRKLIHSESSAIPPAAGLNDATRISDGSYVILKRADRLDGSTLKTGVFREIYMCQKFSSEPLASHPKNHCIRYIEVLRVPDAEDDLIVLPLLFPWELFPHSTIGEAIDFFSQVFEGLQFMHNNKIWHGDCKFNSIMMDASPVLKDDPHPWKCHRTRDFTREIRPLRSRTLNPVRYYWIDFDLSGEYDPSTGPPAHRPGYGGTRDVPEWAYPDRPCNPFAVDVYCLGNMIRGYFTEGSAHSPPNKVMGLEFMYALVADMTLEDPAKRPTMDEVVDRFSSIKAGLSEWKLRSRFTPRQELSVRETIHLTRHWAQQLYFMARRIPAIPSPR